MFPQSQAGYQTESGGFENILEKKSLNVYQMQNYCMWCYFVRLTYLK